jgi:UDP-3-O-acyl-N-acetylglucosamine deacetylase
MVLYQKTIHQEVTFQGKGLFLGREATVRLLPGSPGTGIVFRRTDLAGSPLIAATLENIQDGARCTKIGTSAASIQTIEHLMAALFATGIDNLIVEITGPEMPIFDGSALGFLQILKEAGT